MHQNLYKAVILLFLWTRCIAHKELRLEWVINRYSTREGIRPVCGRQGRVKYEGRYPAGENR